MNIKFFIPISLLVLVNFWIWEIFQINPLISAILVLTTLGSFGYLVTYKKQLLGFLLLLILLLTFFQWNLTDKVNLTELTPPQLHFQNDRVVSYPISKAQIAGRQFNYPLGNLLDGRRETIALYRMNQNFFESLDLNYYFFATHPRERVNIKEFEKFPFIFLPFFILGLLVIKYKQAKTFLAIMLLIPLLLISYIGANSQLGIFVFYPFVCSLILLSIYSMTIKLLVKK